LRSLSRLRYARFPTTIDAIAAKIVTERTIGVTTCRTSRPFANFRRRSQATAIRRITSSRRNASGESGSSRQVFNHRLRFDHSSGNRFINRTSWFPTEVCTRHAGYAVPRLTVSLRTVTAFSTLTLTSFAFTWRHRITPAAVTSTAIAAVASITPPAGITSIASRAAVIWMVASIMSRIRIALVVRQRIPANIVAERKTKIDKRNKRGPPPASLLVEVTTRHPDPNAVVMHPAPIVIRRPTPGFETNPSPAIRRTPRPMTITIWRPVAERVDYTRVWPPNPTVFAGLVPLSVVVKVFSAPNIFIEVLGLVAGSSRDITLTLAHPLVNRVAWSGSEQIPVSGVISNGH